MADLRVAQIMKDSIVDGPGLRYVIFTQGCYHKCEGCHNPQTHDPTGGMTKNTDDLFIEIMLNPTYTGVTFSGGEPFLQSDALADLAIKIKHSSRKDDLDIICYTGYTFEQLWESIHKNNIMSHMRLLYNIDYLIDGPFIKDKASLECKWRGSTNQRIIDVKATIRNNGVIVEADI